MVFVVGLTLMFVDVSPELQTYVVAPDAERARLPPPQIDNEGDAVMVGVGEALTVIDSVVAPEQPFEVAVNV